MARRLRDAGLDSREARRKLKVRGGAHYRLVEPGLHLGYRRLAGRSGTWVLRHYIGARKYEHETIGAADDNSDADGKTVLNFWQAVDEARKRMTERAGGNTGPLTVADVMDQYLEFLDASRKSALDARLRAKAHIYPTLGKMEVASLTPEILRKWHANLAKQPARLRTRGGERQQYRKVADGDEWKRRRRSSANRVLTIVKAALNHAFHDGKITSDVPWRKVKPFASVDAARVRYLSFAEAKRLINAADLEFRPLVQAGLQTGCRYGELIRLTVADLNRDSGTLTIRTSKSGKARHVVLTDEGRALFKQLAAGRSGHALLLRRASGEPWKASHQSRPMAEACERARITPPASFHTLRHTWASHAAMNGVPLLVVAKNLGHADTRMVERHYGHLAPSYIADAIRAGAPRFGFTADPKIQALR